MLDLICNTSPIQYLYQLELLELLPKLSKHVVIPQAVEKEISDGHKNGVSLPDLNKLSWLKIEEPASRKALPLIKDLGAGESEVLMLGLEKKDAVVVLDDLLARKLAENLNIKLTGTLGLLLDAKNAGIIELVEPFLNELESLRFRLSPATRSAVLKLADE